MLMQRLGLRPAYSSQARFASLASASPSRIVIWLPQLRRRAENTPWRGFVNVFLTGATGYIGGSVAVRLLEVGHRVRGLVRTSEKAELLAKSGIEPVVGTLDDVELLAREARKADGVVNTANADHLPSARALIAALEGTGKPLLHTSGSKIGRASCRERV